ncbi:unnamed protein product [Allacma fusca]|uniref:Uncharacterized protein n=1 Tax=Allacma fusca TaxID=39272 RepID=A0A8J2JAB0_9HEXA|nr:unnamed protein product [Allacma fusca]
MEFNLNVSKWCVASLAFCPISPTNEDEVLHNGCCSSFTEARPCVIFAQQMLKRDILGTEESAPDKSTDTDSKGFPTCNNEVPY